MTTTDALALDARVAEKVMGCWLSYHADRQLCGCPDSDHATAKSYDLRHYTTDIAADYEVLAHVRVTWDGSKRERFGSVLRTTWSERAEEYSQVFAVEGDPVMYYNVGDYARAALAVMEGE